jgi:hypothetical protein
MIGHKIQDDAHVALVRALDQLLQIRQLAEDGVHVGVVRHVIAKVGHR